MKPTEATKDTTKSENGHYEIHSKRSQMPFMEDLAEQGRGPASGWNPDACVASGYVSICSNAGGGSNRNKNTTSNAADRNCPCLKDSVPQ